MATTTRQTSAQPARHVVHLLEAMVVAIIAVALLGLALATQSLRPDATPAHLGEVLTLDGADLVVQGVYPEHMAPMHASGFANTGMSMGGMLPDATPDGYRRFTIKVLLIGRSPGFPVSGELFSVSGPGLAPIAPLRHQLGETVLGPGARLIGHLTFQVPTEADGLVLEVKGAARPLTLELPPAEDHH